MRTPLERLRAAFAAAPRAGFLPERSRHLAGYDGPLGIGHSATNSQPRTVAEMLSLLDVRPGQKVLDVGSGSGWTTALLAHLVGPQGSVLGVELVPELVEWGSGNLAAAGVPWAHIEQAERGVLGRPERAPFDRILVSAEPRVLPESLVSQLAPDGVLVIPVDGVMTLVVMTPDGPEVTHHGYYSFVPLR